MPTFIAELEEVNEYEEEQEPKYAVITMHFDDGHKSSYLARQKALGRTEDKLETCVFIVGAIAKSFFLTVLLFMICLPILRYALREESCSTQTANISLVCEPQLIMYEERYTSIFKYNSSCLVPIQYKKPKRLSARDCNLPGVHAGCIKQSIVLRKLETFILTDETGIMLPNNFKLTVCVEKIREYTYSCKSNMSVFYQDTLHTAEFYQVQLPDRKHLDLEKLFDKVGEVYTKTFQTSSLKENTTETASLDKPPAPVSNHNPLHQVAKQGASTHEGKEKIRQRELLSNGENFLFNMVDFAIPMISRLESEHQ